MLLYNQDIKYDSKKRRISKEKFESLLDYLAYVLCEEYKNLLDKGLINKFNKHNIQTDKPRGRIDILSQYRTGAAGKFELTCSVQRLDINNYYNSVIKTAMRLLLRLGEEYKVNKYNENESDNSDGEEKFVDPQRLKQLIYYIDTLDSVEYIENIDDLEQRKLDDIPTGYDVIYNVQMIILRYFQPRSKQINPDDFEQNRIKDRYYVIYEKFVRNLYRKELRGFDTSKCTDSKRPRRIDYSCEYELQSDNKLTLEPDSIIEYVSENKDKKRLLIIDTKWYNSLADEYTSENGKRNNDKDKPSIYNRQIGIYNQEIGKSCLYAMAYKNQPEYKDYEICTLVLMAKNLRSSGEYAYDDAINHQIAFYRPPDNAINFQIAVVHHTMDMNFVDIKKDLLNIANRFLSDDPLGKEWNTLP